MRQDLPPPVPVRETSGMAIASLVLGCGVIFMGCLTGIPAVICGILGLRKIKKNPGLGGTGLAIAGIILGGLSLIFIPILAAIAIPAVGAALDAAKQVQEMNDSKILAGMLHEYAEKHDGKYPDNLTVLLEGDESPDALKKMLYKEGTNDLKWNLTQGLTTESPGDTILLQSIQSSGKGRRKGKVISRVDGSARIVRDDGSGDSSY